MDRVKVQEMVAHILTGASGALVESISSSVRTILQVVCQALITFSLRQPSICFLPYLSFLLSIYKTNLNSILFFEVERCLLTNSKACQMYNFV